MPGPLDYMKDFESVMSPTEQRANELTPLERKAQARELNKLRRKGRPITAEIREKSAKGIKSLRDLNDDPEMRDL